MSQLRIHSLLILGAALLGGCAQTPLVGELASDIASLTAPAPAWQSPSAGRMIEHGTETNTTAANATSVDIIGDGPNAVNGSVRPTSVWGEATVHKAAATLDLPLETQLKADGNNTAKPTDKPVQVADGWHAPSRRVVSPAPMAPAPMPMAAAPVAWGPAVVVSGDITGGPTGHEAYILDTGDRLRVFVYGQPNLSRLYTVDQVGNIAVPLIGSVRARGRSTVELGRAIAQRLAREYVKDPQVTVDVAQNRPFFILGEVRQPGQFPYVSGMTIEQAIAIAGGYTERASHRRFRITRKLGPLVDQIEAPSDYPLLPGDTVYVFERFF